MKKICYSLFFVFIACKQDNIPPVNKLTGKVKSIHIENIPTDYATDYTFQYDASNGNLISIKKDSAVYVTIEHETDSTQIIHRYDPYLGHEKYLILYNPASKFVRSVNRVFDDSSTFETHHFSYFNNHLDSLYEFGVPFLQDQINSYDFIFLDNNCVSYNSDYFDRLVNPANSHTSLEYYNGLINQRNIPLQSIFQIDFAYSGNIIDAISLSYISQLCGLTPGHVNNNLLRTFGPNRYNYHYNTDSLVNEIKHYALPDTVSLYRNYLIDYY